MRKICLYFGAHLNNKIFDLEDPIVNRDGCALPYALLKKELEKFDINLSTQDINKPMLSDAVIYNDIPKNMRLNDFHEQSFLLQMESPIIRPQNFNTKNYQFFEKIFTWADDLVDNKKFFKINYSYARPKVIQAKEKTQFLTMIAANKHSQYRNELYSERKKVIEWYAMNNSDKFDLYGRKWGEISAQNRYLNFAIKKMNLKRKKNWNGHNVFKGSITAKSEVLGRYKFAICFENYTGINGYITEKIFDAFLNGVVPIYYGAPNVCEHIPNNCFINYCDFKNIQEMHDYLTSMSKVEYQSYQENINHFIYGSEFETFTAAHFAKIVSKEVMRSLK